jgi:hypothetical protein
MLFSQPGSFRTGNAAKYNNIGVMAFPPNMTREIASDDNNSLSPFLLLIFTTFRHYMLVPLHDGAVISQ